MQQFRAWEPLAALFFGLWRQFGLAQPAKSGRTGRLRAPRDEPPCPSPPTNAQSEPVRAHGAARIVLGRPVWRDLAGAAALDAPFDAICARPARQNASAYGQCRIGSAASGRGTDRAGAIAVRTHRTPLPIAHSALPSASASNAPFKSREETRRQVSVSRRSKFQGTRFTDPALQQRMALPRGET
jgi:hypothetical protein